ncbi:hypothetical protein [Cecembia rubra]|uniref:hypothetical protein n=1 Tax=Cecembia rubra TaxID=1485585 RepID=UPI002714E559|nr:hypothetical protein [Cecembia rubra]
MKLTEKDIETLHYHINAKQIPYIEVRDEVLDHYQTALELEQERSMEEVLAELDQTFTISYCKEIADSYINQLRSEYPNLLKRKLIEMFGWKRLPITLFIIGIGLSLPYFFTNAGALVHILNAFVLGLNAIETYMLQYSYPKRKTKHHYRLVDDKPILARIQSRSLKGLGFLPVTIYLLLSIPLLFIYLGNAEEPRDSFLFNPPYIYSICLLTGLLVLFHIASFAVSLDHIKPKLR